QSAHRDSRDRLCIRLGCKEAKAMSQVSPTVRYLIVCEDVQTDPDNPRHVTLVGLISTIRALEQPAFPLLFDEICVFLQLTECRGPAEGRIEIQHADSGHV